MSKAGIVEATLVGFDADMSDYHTDEIKRGDPALVIHRSDLVEISACPAKWFHGQDFGGNESTRHGDLVDMLFCERTDGYTIKPETYPAQVKGETVIKPWNGNATACKEWLAEHEGEFIVSRKELDKAAACDFRLRNHQQAGPIAAESQFQALVTGVYLDKSTGLSIPLKTSIDIVPNRGTEFERWLLDLKTAKSVAPHDWSQACWFRGYDMQAAINIDLYEAATLEGRDLFGHIAQENSHPWHPECIRLPEEFLRIGRLKYQSAMELYCHCLSENRWPGYQETGAAGEWPTVEPLPWMVMAAEAKDSGTLPMSRMIPDWAMEDGDE